MKCQRCNGNGYHFDILKNLGTLNYKEHVVPCDAPACRNGQVTKESRAEYYRSIMTDREWLLTKHRSKDGH